MYSVNNQEIKKGTFYRMLFAKINIIDQFDRIINSAFAYLNRFGMMLREIHFTFLLILIPLGKDEEEYNGNWKI